MTGLSTPLPWSFEIGTAASVPSSSAFAPRWISLEGVDEGVDEGGPLGVPAGSLHSNGRVLI